MYDALGVVRSSFTCSVGGNSTCQGTTGATQRTFQGLQTQINRVGVRYGTTRLAVDGKVGPTTVRVLLQLVSALQQQLQDSLDPSLSALLVELEGQPTTAQDVALDADRLFAALGRDGAKEGAWAVLTSIKDIAAQLVAASGSPTTSSAPTPGGGLINPYPDTPAAPQTPIVTQLPATIPTSTTVWSPGWPAPTTASGIFQTGIPMWAVAVGAGVLTLIGSVVAAVVHSRRRSARS